MLNIKYLWSFTFLAMVGRSFWSARLSQNLFPPLTKKWIILTEPPPIRLATPQNRSFFCSEPHCTARWNRVSCEMWNVMCSVSICPLIVSSCCRCSGHTKAVQRRSLSCTRSWPTKGTASMWTNGITLRGQSLLWSLTLFVYCVRFSCQCSLELCKIFTAAINYLRCGSVGGRIL